MSFISATYFVDYVNGNDATRTKLDGVTTADNGFGYVRCTKTAHGLVDGAVIDVVEASPQTDLQGPWQVLRIDADHFDLVPATHAQNSTLVLYPRGGASWADAWKTINAGMTAERCAGNTGALEIRIAQSPVPAAIGNAAWTDRSKVVTLATAQTATVELCETAWTAANGAAAATTGTRKQGSYSAKITAPASPAGSTLYAYKTVTQLDLSAFQKLSFWLFSSADFAAYRWTLCLCSDTAGTTVVDSIEIPEIPQYGMWCCLTLARAGGGNLGAAIQSVALYSGLVAPASASYLFLDDIIACATDGLNLQSLISKSSAAQGGTEAWWGIQSIDGTTVHLDQGTATSAGTTIAGYAGTTETVATYRREALHPGMNSLASQSAILIPGTPSAATPYTFRGGWDPATGNQTGESWFDGQNGYANGLQCNKANVSLEYLSFCRYASGIYSAGADFSVQNCHTGNCGNFGLSLVNCRGVTLAGGRYVAGSSVGVFLSNSTRIRGFLALIAGNQSHGLYATDCTGVELAPAGTIRNNRSYGIYAVRGADVTIRAVTLRENLEGAATGTHRLRISQAALVNQGTIEHASQVGGNFRVCWHDLNGAAGNHRIATDGGLIESEGGSNRHTAAGLAWRLTPTATYRTADYPLDLRIAEVYCAANVQATVKAWVKKTHATSVGAKLVCRGGQIAGVAADVTATKTGNTSWEELSISFTPTAAGVVWIELWAFYVSATGQSVYVDDLTLPTGFATAGLDLAEFAQPWAQNAPAAGGSGGTRAYAFIGG